MFGEIRRHGRQQLGEQPMPLQHHQAHGAMPGEEELQRLVEQARRRHATQQLLEVAYGGAGLAIEREAQFGFEARCSQHAHRVLAITRHGVAYQLQAPRRDVLDATRVIPDREVRDVVVQRVRGEIPAPDVIVDGAVSVVAQDAPVFVGDAVFIVLVGGAGARVARPVTLDQGRVAVDAGSMRSRLCEHRALVGGIQIVVVQVLVRIEYLVVIEIGHGRFDRHIVDGRAHRAKRGHLDDVTAEEHMREAEATADEAAIAKGALHLFGQRAGRDIEVLRRDADQQVAYTPAHQESLVARLAQSIEHAQRIGRNRGPRYGMFGTRDDARGGPGARFGSRVVVLKRVVQDLKVPLGMGKAAYILPRSILDPAYSDAPFV